jgi:hypothetical protein
MPHLYHVEHTGGDGKSKTTPVTVPDTHHHSMWENTQDFTKWVAAALGIASSAITIIKYVGEHKKR